MPRIPYQAPPPGENPVADRIRERRGARGLTPLDQTLLNNPAIADGWNSLLGAVRSKNSLPDDVRELMILRIAARNRAAFEWIHHEHVGRKGGLTTSQLSTIRDVSSGPSAFTPPAGTLSPLQAAALAFADFSTVEVHVPDAVFDELRKHLSETQLFEATATVATYNMVSRLLVALDVDDKASLEVPHPVDEPASGSSVAPTSGEHKVALPDVTLHAQLHVLSPTAPWLVFANSLLTNLSLWSGAAASLSSSYNLLLFDQRGHGQSSVPAAPATMDQLADDVAALLDHFGIARAHAVLGVSQGGATTLNFGRRHPTRAGRLVACDTQAKSPAANTAAWDERIALAREKGMGALAEATVSRWFPAGSEYVEGAKREVVREQVRTTPLEGFVVGARALQGYDLTPALAEKLKEGEKKVLLVAGEKDGKLPETLETLAGELGAQGVPVQFAKIAGAGHLPMLDGLEQWLDVVGRFLKE